ncbi:MAG: discoidin domain-containing protein [Myxococcales bacterium]|nr:discoidin domain-containing protein [Myxococcales bacterium]
MRGPGALFGTGANQAVPAPIDPNFAIAADTRHAVAKLLATSQQSIEVAETLWAAGSRLDALTSAEQGFQSLMQAARCLARQDEPLDAILQRLSFAPQRREQVLALEATPALFPDAHSRLRPRHADRFTAQLQACRWLQSVLWPTILEPPLRQRAQRQAALVLASIALLCVSWLGAVRALTAPHPTFSHARASAYRTSNGQGEWTAQAPIDAWPPDNAIDRDEMSYWHLPPSEPGWIELTLSESRRISAVRILNAHDGHSADENRHDRRRFDIGSNQGRIRALARDGSELAVAAFALAPVVDFGFESIELEASNVARLRIEIDSWHGRGGGLAEVELVP